MPTPPTGPRRASYLTLLALLLVVLIGFVAIAVDVSTLLLADEELETAVDAAALAGASHLDDTAGGLLRATTSAIAVGHRNEVRRTPLELMPAQIEFGEWDYDTSTFVPRTDPRRIDAVRIRRTVDQVPTPFAGVAFSSWFSSVEADAVAVRPPPEPVKTTKCFIPVAISTCTANVVESSDPALHSFRFGPDSQDDIAWAYPGGVNANVVRAALNALATGQCLSGTQLLGIGDELALQNGIVASNLSAVRNLLDLSMTTWDTAKWGPKPPQDPNSVFPPGVYDGLGVIMGPIPVVDDGGNCAMRYNHAAPINHLVWGVIYDEYLRGNRKGFAVFVDMEHDWTDPGGDPGGGGSGNVVAWPPARLVE